MAEEARVTRMFRFGTEFRTASGKSTSLDGWRPKLTYLEYIPEGEDEARTILAVDLPSLVALLNDHGFLSPGDVGDRGNAAGAMKLVASIYALADSDITLDRRAGADGKDEFRLTFRVT